MANIGLGAVNGPSYNNITQVSANYTVVAGDEVIQVTTATSTIRVTLPTPVTAGIQAGDGGVVNSAGALGNQGQRVTIEKIDTGNGTVTIVPQTLGTVNIGNSYSLANRWSQATFLSDGTRWNLLGTVS